MAWLSKTHCVLAVRLKNHLWQSPCFRDTQLGFVWSNHYQAKGAEREIDKEREKRKGQKGIHRGGDSELVTSLAAGSEPPSNAPRKK